MWEVAGGVSADYRQAYTGSWRWYVYAAYGVTGARGADMSGESKYCTASCRVEAPEAGCAPQEERETLQEVLMGVIDRVNWCRGAGKGGRSKMNQLSRDQTLGLGWVRLGEDVFAPYMYSEIDKIGRRCSVDR